MTKEEIIEKINHVLAEEFEIEPKSITPDAMIKETLDLDSLDYVDLVVIIEFNFGFKVSGEDFMHIHSFQDIYDYVINKINNKEGVA